MTPRNHHHSYKSCLSSRDATTLGIILGKFLTNSLKHAFPDHRVPQIYISFGLKPNG